jgi:hypothetical protein
MRPSQTAAQQVVEADNHHRSAGLRPASLWRLQLNHCTLGGRAWCQGGPGGTLPVQVVTSPGTSLLLLLLLGGGRRARDRVIGWAPRAQRSYYWHRGAGTVLDVRGPRSTVWVPSWRSQLSYAGFRFRCLDERVLVRRVRFQLGREHDGLGGSGSFRGGRGVLAGCPARCARPPLRGLTQTKVLAFPTLR